MPSDLRPSIDVRDQHANAPLLGHKVEDDSMNEGLLGRSTHHFHEWPLSSSLAESTMRTSIVRYTLYPSTPTTLQNIPNHLLERHSCSCLSDVTVRRQPTKNL
jgi:hypothetical protein